MALDSSNSRYGVFKSAELPDEDDDNLKEAIFAVFFGTSDKRAERNWPFYELPQAAIETMPQRLKAAYLGDLVVAQDPRSGREPVPYISERSIEAQQGDCNV